MKKRYFIFLFVGMLSFLSAQKIDSAKLDQYFDVLEQNHKVMGSFAIAKDGKVIYNKTIGFSDVESRQKADAQTIYRIGSITKTFTSVMMMQAVEENKLKLSQKLSDFYPQIQNASQISIREMLQHRSGIHNYTSDSVYFEYNTKPMSEEEMLKIITEAGSDFSPGTKFEYSNSNYYLLGLILENIYKKPYAQLLQEKICKPLDLKFTTVGGKIDPAKNIANSYTYFGGEYQKSSETDMSVPGGAGNIVSTPEDLIRFMQALADGKLVSTESLEQMKGFQDDYGFGLVPVPFNGKTGFGHNGGIDYFQSVLYYFPEGKVTFAMITNQSNYNNNQISIAALSAAYGLDFQVPSFGVVEVNTEDLEPFVGIYSNASFPLKIKIFIEDNKLYAQATGQSSFPLEATSPTEFKFDLAGITLKFNSEKGEMFYTQMGQALTFKKEN